MSTGRTARRRFVCLDLGFSEDPKILTVGNSAAGLYARSLSYSGNHRTDGFIPEAWARGAGKPAERRKLVDHGLWLAVEFGYQIPNWERYQQTRAQIEALEDAHRRGAAKTNEARWGDRSSDTESDTVLANAGASRYSGRNQNENQNGNDKGSRGEMFVKGSSLELPLEKDSLVARLLDAIGNHADEGTAGVIRSYAARLPEAALAKVHESLSVNRELVKQNRAGYVVSALKSEIEERQPR
jgi:hypothetical protein